MAKTQSAGTMAGPATGSPPAPPGPNGGRGANTGQAGPAGRPARPGRQPERGRRTTPARLWSSLLAVTVSILLLTAAAAVTVRGEADSARQTSGPVEAQAVYGQELNYALSDADAAAATGILDSPAPSARFTDRYQADITEADDAITASAVDVSGNQNASAQLQYLQEHLSEYTGLIATAQANNRQGFAVGGAYLREASNLLEGPMLTEAQAVLQAQEDAQSASAADSGGFAYWPLIAALLVLAAGVWSWRLLAERTRRAVNAGLAAALLGALAVTVWSAASSYRAGSDMSVASTDFGHVSAAQQARGFVAQISADEASSVVSHGADISAGAAKGDNGAAADKGNTALAGLGSELTLVEAADTAPGRAASDGRLYQRIKTDVATIQSDVGKGDFATATTDMVGGDSSTVGGALADLNSLSDSLADSEQDFQSAYQRDGKSAADDYPGGPWPIALVGLVAAGLAGFGINRRIAEYR